MSIISVLFLSVLLCLPLSASGRCPPGFVRNCSASTDDLADPSAAPASPAERKLVWQDDFDGDSLDESKWNVEIGYLNVNGEQENYQPENIEVSYGSLIITGRREPKGQQNYTSGRINTSHVNIRIVDETVWWDNEGEDATQDRDTEIVYAAPWHVYAAEWNEKSIAIYADGKQYFKMEIGDIPALHKPFFIVLNLAIGGEMPGQTVDDSKFPVEYWVDYVRVYEL